jgi:anaerobic magnesium-protoporphyrin IX monomethyl ester cyclase
MRVSLVGADNEENLGIEMIAASLRAAKHRVDVVPYYDAADADVVADRILARRPDLVGLAIQFQHRAREFLLLAKLLRERGFGGHITCGGQHPTMAHAEILQNEPAVDSVVLHEGERTVVDLAAALSSRAALESVPGMALRAPDGTTRRSPARMLCQNLDELPTAYRWRDHTRHLGIPFIPITGSRGCWGSCAFCAINAYYRDARAHGKGRTLRLRSAENVAAEMAALWHAHGGPCIFCFHDDTLLLPRPADTLERLGRIRSALDQLGVGEVAIIGKTRPDVVTPELARSLRRLGVIRMFVGIENGSQRGQDHLDRHTRTEDLHRALDAFEAAGIFVCYNLLLFEPDGSLEDVRENITFMRRHAGIPVNFCRAEPYHGTPLFRRLETRNALLGNYLGWDYRITDDRTELLFRVCLSAFKERKYSPRGVNNRYIGLGYTAQILRCMYDVSSVPAARLLGRVDQLVRDVSGDTADLLEQALRMVGGVDLGDRDRIEIETARLGLRVSAHDRVWLARIDELTDEIDQFVAARRREQRQRVPQRLREVASQLAVAGCLVAALPGCGGQSMDGNPNDGDAAPQVGGYGGFGGMVGDGGGPPSGGGGAGGYFIGGDGGAPPYGGAPGDGGAPPAGGAPPYGDGGGPPYGGGGAGGYFIGGDGGAPPYGGAGGLGSGDTDAQPFGGGGGDARPFDAPADGKTDGKDTGTDVGGESSVDSAILGANDRATLADHWRNSGPERIVRSRDLPLFDLPAVTLEARAQGGGVRVRASTDERGVCLGWDAEGRIEGHGMEVTWYPASPGDRISVAVRSSGGVSIATLNACDVAGSDAQG